MTPSLVVRPAALPDARAIAATRVAGWRSAYAGMVPQSFLDRLSAESDVSARASALAAMTPPRFTIVAEYSGAVIGFASGGPDRDERNAVGELYAIYVNPDHIGTGAGAALMHAALDTLRPDFDAIGVWVLERNDRARRFYERFGLVATEERRILDLDGPVPEVRHAGVVDPLTDRGR